MIKRLLSLRTYSAGGVLRFGIAASLSFWVIDALMGSVFFHKGSFLGQLVLPGRTDLLERLLVFGIVAGVAFHSHRLIFKSGQNERKLREIAATDMLTGILNRAKFDEIMETELERAERYNRTLSVVIFDIDDFKAVNDTYGHLAGDEVLKSTALAVRSLMRKPNHFFRWGGEEFLIIVVETGIEGALALSERIRGVIEKRRFEHGGGITASFGVVECGADDTTASLLRKADSALYCAKKLGKNRVEAFSPSLYSEKVWSGLQVG